MLEKYALLRVLRFILDYDKEFTIRGLARLAGVGSGTSKAVIDFLAKKGILKKRPISEKQSTFFLDREDVLVKQIKILKSLLEIKNSGLVQEIVKRFPDVLSIIIYGSVARGEDDKHSDIDLLIIARKPIEVHLFKSERHLSREVTYHVYAPNGWREKAKKDKVFYDRVLLDGIALYGEKLAML